MWTQFMDMHSGGGNKEGYDYIYVELPEREAVVWFYNRFGHNPNRVTCTCCGEDYSISESETLEGLTGYERGCRYDDEKREYVEEVDPIYSKWKQYMTLDEYKQKDNILIVSRDEVNPEELEGEVPEEGYVWV